MEKYWTNICQILTIIISILIGLSEGSIAKEDLNTLSFFNRHYDCIPKLIHNGVVVNTTSLSNGHHIDDVTLAFVAFGRQLKVDLSLNKHLFPQSYVERVFHFNGTGVDDNSTTEMPENCYYHGIVRGQPRSEAAISTCHGGISGYITDRRDSYHIQPLQGRRVHRVYRNSDQRKLPFKCGTVGRDARLHSHQQVMKRYKRSVQAPYDSNRNTRYVELYLVNDYRTYERHGKNKDIVIKRSQDIANIVSSLYRQLNIYVALVGVEVWGLGDLIIISKSADSTMENFLRYRKERINPYHHNDNAQLITGKFFDHGVVGKAIKGPICTHQFSGGVNMDYGGPVTLVATTVAHEMGHNFGMEHDNDTMCQCREEKCIMAATSGQISPKHWSSCSQNTLAEAFDLGMDYCLQNIPQKIFDGPVCGNGFKEDGEECDCGLPKDCTNRCCNPKTCQMFPGAQCATGMCCDLVECKPKRASTMCRKPVSECDLPEYCDGNKEYCPSDYHVQDGIVCQHGESYCYKGQCKTHTNQCKLLWGESGRVSDPICFQQLNMKGDEKGSCAYNWTTNRYSRCDREDVLCGLLHCVHLNEKLMFWKDNLALVMGVSFLSRGNKQYVCRSAILDVGLDMKDPGLVPDGAKCEENKICINQKCVSLAKLDVSPCRNNCEGHGLCNSNNTCHCDIGYAPPLCDSPGYGGSLSSGPASQDIEKRDSLIILLIALVVLIVVVLAILAYFNRGRRHQCLARVPNIKYRVKGKSEKTRSPSLLDSSTPVSRSDSSNSSSGNPPAYTQKPTIWNPVKPTWQVPPKRPLIAPKCGLTSTKTSSNSTSKEQFSNHNANFTSSQPDIGTISNSVPSNNIPNSPKTSSKGIVKRESIRGSKISEPVLMSTTNRNSVVLADMQVSIIGPEAERESCTDSPSQRKKATDNSVKRSFSDRQVVRPDILRHLPVTQLGDSGPLKKSESLKVTSNAPPVAEDEKELIYANDMDVGSLLQDIEQELKGDNVYYNVSNNNPFQSAVLQIEDPPQLPHRESQPVTVNNFENTKSSTNPFETALTQNPAILVLPNANHTNKNPVMPGKEDHVNTTLPKSTNNNDKIPTPQLSKKPIDELKRSLQAKNKSPASPKKVVHNSPVPTKANLANKPTMKNGTTSRTSNPPKAVVSQTFKNESNSTGNKKGEGTTSKAPLSRANSATVGSNKKSNVSNLAARFSQGGEETDKKSGTTRPVLKRNQTMTGSLSSAPDKPGISPKPKPPPKPANSGDGSPSTRPATGVKRVHSYRI